MVSDQEGPVTFTPTELAAQLEALAEIAGEAAEEQTLKDSAACIRDGFRVTGPKCPKCGRFLKAEHRREKIFADGKEPPCVPGFKYYARGDRSEDCRISESDLLANHPEIAREMGITA